MSVEGSHCTFSGSRSSGTMPSCDAQSIQAKTRRLRESTSARSPLNDPHPSACRSRLTGYRRSWTPRSMKASWQGRSYLAVLIAPTIGRRARSGSLSPCFTEGRSVFGYMVIGFSSSLENWLVRFGGSPTSRSLQSRHASQAKISIRRWPRHQR